MKRPNLTPRYAVSLIACDSTEDNENGKKKEEKKYKGQV